MQADQFNKVLSNVIQNTVYVLGQKAGEYADDTDRLHNFKVAAALQGESAREALAGMLAKCTVSIFDMCKSGKTYTPEMWDKKIGNHINYLILLRAVVAEEYTDLDQQMLDFTPKEQRV